MKTESKISMRNRNTTKCSAAHYKRNIINITNIETAVLRSISFEICYIHYRHTHNVLHNIINLKQKKKLNYA